MAAAHKQQIKGEASNINFCFPPIIHIFSAPRPHGAVGCLSNVCSMWLCCIIMSKLAYYAYLYTSRWKGIQGMVNIFYPFEV